MERKEELSSEDIANIEVQTEPLIAAATYASTDASVLHHSLLMPFIRLDERCLKDIAIDPDDNDVCLMAADICVSCYHFVERVAHRDSHLAGRLRGVPRWRVLGDIANTRKHFVRHKAARQVRLHGRLAFEIGTLETFGFIRTEVIATTSRGDEHEVLDMLAQVIQHFRKTLGLDQGTTIVAPPPRPRSFKPAACCRLSHETLMLRRTSGKLYRRKPTGELVPVEGGIEFTIEVQLDLPASITIGRHRISFDLEAAKNWFSGVDLRQNIS